MKTVILAAAIAASVAVPAYAQDSKEFNGPHAEIITGYDTVKGTGAGSPDGLLYGLNLGYDLQMGGVVLGLEGEVADSTANANLGGTKIDAARDLYVGGRIGTPITSNTLAYVKAGYTNARIEAKGFGGTNGDGVRVGAGLEHKLNDRFTIKGEYRYSNYEAGVERHQLVAGLGVRF